MQTQRAELQAPTPDLSDAELVTRLQSGEAADFVTLMRRHNRSVYRVVRSVIRDEPTVEEVMQEAYVNAFTHLVGQ